MTRAAPARAGWTDLEPLRRSLLAGDGCSFAAPAWLSDAASDPAGFWRALGPALVAAPAGSSRSTLFERYQLAHELGARHASGRAPALVTHDDSVGARASSYARVVETARALAGGWRARGARAGMVVALVAPPSPELVAGLLAAWQLGAVPAPIPVRGRTYLRDRLAALGPDAVASSKGHALWLEVPAEQRLPVAATGNEPDPGAAHAYAPDEAALRVFSPLGDAPLQPFDVSAERLYLGAVRDGALFFGLGAGLGLAAPGACEAHVVPALLFACLATGAHYIAVGIEDACRRPELVLGGQVHVLGVDARLRDAVLAADAGGPGPARWFRNPAAAHEPAAWGRLAASRPFSRARGACYFPSPVAGGAITWSPWRRSPELNVALPAPGLPWQLVDPGRGGAPSTDGTGVLACSDPAAPPEALGRPLLGALAGGARAAGRATAGADAQAAGESLWVATLGAHREGRRLPAEEIEALVMRSHAALVWACRLVDDVRAGAALVVFARPDRVAPDLPARDALARALAGTIEAELAPDLAPDRIDVYTLAPRAADEPDPLDPLDRDWCHGQHASGRLQGKQVEPVFTALALLRQALEERDGGGSIGGGG
ncbi:MAG TPA: AMP-binding protein [Kofleriaceae bacterium]|nr:AMP-binding protein [Kofleriaceae bacterium]